MAIVENKKRQKANLSAFFIHNGELSDWVDLFALAVGLNIRNIPSWFTLQDDKMTRGYASSEHEIFLTLFISNAGGW